MKKIVRCLVAAMVCVSFCLCAVACSSGITGTYKFHSMKMTEGAISAEIKVGESYMGITIGEDAVVLEVKDDNTWTMKMNMGGAESAKGTWEKKDDKYVFTASDGSGLEISFDGKTATLNDNNAQIVLKK